MDDEDKLSLRLRIGHTELGGEHACGHLRLSLLAPTVKGLFETAVVL